jgi:hypothetical protein
MSIRLARITYHAKATITRRRLTNPPTSSCGDVAEKGVFGAVDTTNELKRLPRAAKIGNRPARRVDRIILYAVGESKLANNA